MEGRYNRKTTMPNYDDLDIEGRNPSHLSEEEREKEEIDRKRLMRCSVSAVDGTLRPVYSKTDDGDVWCHICNIQLFGAHKLHSHNISSRHKMKLDEWPYPVSLWSKKNSGKSIPGQTGVPDSLAPGEPVPPGMEDQLTRATTIQVSLDRHQSSPLVGLEYLLEIVDNDSCEPNYTCVLCDKRGDPRTVMAHITSYNHRITYLNRHFPTVSRAISDLPRTQNYKRGANEISVLVAKKIEEKFGRLQPQLVDKTQFEKNKMQYIKNVYQDFHFRESPELTFMEVYDVRWVTDFEEKMAEITADMKKDSAAFEEKREDKPKKEESKLDKAFPKKIEPDTTKGEMKIRIMTKEKLNRKPEKEEKKPRPSDDTKSLSSLSSISSSPSPTRSRSRSRSRSRTRRMSSRERTRYRANKIRHGHSRTRSRSNEPLRERDKWDKFRERIRRAEENLDRSLKFHEKNPEKHPSYPEEWKKFWNRRYKELQAEGKDPSKHDFKPEWIEFWNTRMREIHNEQLSARKEEIRKQLELPEDKPPEVKHRQIPIKRDKEERSSPKRPRHLMESDDDVEYVGTKTIKPDRPERVERPERSERIEYHERHREEIREQREYYAYARPKPSYRGYYVPTRPSAPRPRHYAYPMKEKSASPPPKEEALQEDLEIVGLLRLLTALEGQLGSLGPKVVTLLSRALAAEKAKPNSAEELLEDEEVNVLFETVKEKLKGQLFAGMIEKMAIVPTKSAIQNIAQLLHKSSEEKRKREEEEEKRKKQAAELARSLSSFVGRSTFPRTVEVVAVKSEPVTVPGVGYVDKVAIAQQIAAALVAQGRGNVSQDELETLINAVVGMAEASKNSDKPVTAASFVKSLTAGNNLQSSNGETSVPDTPKIIVVPQVVLPKEPVKEKTPPPKIVDPIEAHAARMESLTDNDLKQLLQNFKELGTDEQHGLINFLKKLEASDPSRVEKLRGFVNLGENNSSNSHNRSITPPRELEDISLKLKRSASPFSTRKGGHNPTDDDHAKWKPKLDMFADDEAEEKRKKEEENKKSKIDLSDDDDDYSFEDIYKAADKNVSENEKARKRSSRSHSSSRSWSRSRSRSPPSKKDTQKSNDPSAILNETKRLIANIMGDLPNKYVVKSHLNPMKDNSGGQEVPPPGSTNISMPPSYPNPPSFPNPINPQSLGQNYQQQVPYPPNLGTNQFGNYPPPQPPFNTNQGYMNMGSNNGYGNYNPGTTYPPSINSNQGQYMQHSQFPPTPQNYPGSQYGPPPGQSPSGPPVGYPQPNQYGNYSQQQQQQQQQQQRFY